MVKTKVTPHEELMQLESHLLRVDRDNWRSLATVLAEALRAFVAAHRVYQHDRLEEIPRTLADAG